MLITGIDSDHLPRNISVNINNAYPLLLDIFTN